MSRLCSYSKTGDNNNIIDSVEAEKLHPAASIKTYHLYKALGEGTPPAFYLVTLLFTAALVTNVQNYRTWRL
jgi:hypothetical protein